MEIRRYLNTRTWGEEWFECLSAPEKLVWIYLLTNPGTNMLGIYALSVRRIAYDCHLSEACVRRYIKNLEVSGKVIYQKGYIVIVDWLTQNAMNPSMKLAALKDYDNLPDEVRSTLPQKINRLIEKMRPWKEQPVPNLFPEIAPEHREKEEEQEEEQDKENEQKQEQGREKNLGQEYGNGKRETAHTSGEKKLQPLNEACTQACRNAEWRATLCANLQLLPDELQQWLERFCRKLQNQGCLKKSVRDFRQHFANWLQIQLKNPSKHPAIYENPATTNREESRQRRLDSLAAIGTSVSDAARRRILELEAAGILPPVPET